VSRCVASACAPSTIRCTSSSMSHRV
jgi:hypothetical protein